MYKIKNSIMGVTILATAQFCIFDGMELKEEIVGKLKALLASAWNNRVTPVVWGKGSRKLMEHIFNSQQMCTEKQIEDLFSSILCGNLKPQLVLSVHRTFATSVFNK